MRRSAIYAEARLKATTLALAQASRSGVAGRMPIAGAAVQREAAGSLETVTIASRGLGIALRPQGFHSSCMQYNIIYCDIIYMYIYICI